jgi:predicted ATPase
MIELRELLVENRLVTLTGVGGVGKPAWRCRCRPTVPAKFGDSRLGATFLSG